ncbi:ABC transporter C family member 8-like isoform X5 [Vitis riparia]|uniref:ABC transporter C family member 8-like isoform X5 n=1 Tax=Vitis riparia TaxID=96939 RepID=UPI00155A6933|nr:ABC transporter C family member 8-like isoform X5 [Vitis riparia]
MLYCSDFVYGCTGGFSWNSGEGLDMGFFCVQTTILDVLNLLFLSVFCVILVMGSVRKNVIFEHSRRDWVSGGVSICCAVVSIGYLSAGLWDLFVKNEGSGHLSWWVYFVRGLVWISLAVSLLIQRPKWIRILSSLWWLAFFLLGSSLNIGILVKTHNIQVFDMVPWLVNFLLLFCAFRIICHHDSPDTPDRSVSEPLLGKRPVKSSVELGKSSFISKLTFSWINPLLCLGYSKPLVLEDIPSLESEDGAELAYQKFAHAWEQLQKEKTPNNSSNLVLQALARVYLKETLSAGIFALFKTISVVVSPLLLYAFVKYSNHSGENWHEGVFLVGCLVLNKLVESLSQRHWFLNSRRSGMRMRSSLMVAVYQKQLKLSSLGRGRHSTGEIVNYIAIDAYRMGEFPWWFHTMWSFILQLFLSIGVLFGIVGLGALTGLVPLLICGLLNVPFAKIIQRCQFQFMMAQDQRLRSTSEILNSMKVIKLQSWEEKFKNLIESLRDIEFKWLAEAHYKKCYCTVLYWLSPSIIPSVIFLGCVVFRSAPLDASTIFTVLAALRCMSEPVRTIPEALSALIQIKISFDRLNAFLLDDEVKSEEIRKVVVPNSHYSVIVNGCGFSWDPKSTILTLRDVNMEVKWGQKVAVCGPVGAGKSSLLYAILGEIPKVSGTVDVFGSIAYVSQTSWIQSGTIRDNILYGRPMDKTKYEKAIKACALDKDINSFDHGDLTEIGQRGLNMSGGQKQRIQLARAVYNDANIYLLDDPFSAVDAHTAAVLFNDCIMSALAQKTVILVTHQVEFLSAVDKILVMEVGQITQTGSYEELFAAGTAFEQLVNAHKNATTVMNLSNKEIQEEPHMLDQSPTKESGEGEISMKGQQGVQLTEEEEREIGDVGWKPFLDYLLVSKGSFLLFLCIITKSGFIALQAASTYWLALAIEMPKISNGMLIGVYAGLSTLSTGFIYLRSFFGARLGLKASKAFFAGFTNSIFKAPMLFFDSTPVGRILTRASSDLSVLDFDIPFSIIFVVASGLELLSIIGVTASITWPVLIVAIFAIVAVYYVQGYYLASARELIRINGTTKAPVMSYAAETSLGVVTIRAFNMADRFFQNYLELIDTDAKLFFYSNAAIEWLVLRIEILQNLTLVTAALLVVLLPKGYVAPGLVGLSLSYALALTGTQVFFSRWYCNLSNYVVSVERIKQFMHIPSEPPAIVEEKRPPTSWPSKGRIDLQYLKIKYRPNAPLVLKGITCTFKEGTRVGIVGRTGSGKTTLISALFRLVEPESGKIFIDGLDICSIGLKDLRMKLSIIPQEPTLFKGSIRTNLDPLGLYSDDEIWEALEKCQLKATISSLPNLLDSSVF